MSDDVDLGAAATRVAGLLPGVTQQHLGAPTPSADLAVVGLLAHLLGLAEAFRAGAAKEPDSGPPPAVPPVLPPGWRQELPFRLDGLARAWREPGAREGSTSVGGVRMPAAMIAAVALNELVVHGWELAVATGQPYLPEDAEVAACRGFVAAVAGPEGVPGLFGPAVAVAPDAPAFDRLLGLTGRDPGWTRPAPA